MPIVFDSTAGTITGLSVGGLPDGIVDAGTLADDAITAAKIDDNAVGTAAIADDAITAAKIDDDAVGAAAIADEAIDEARMQISNAGTNGQVLSKQSGNTGGLTWADSGGGGAYSDWLVKTANFTCASGDQLVCNHASVAFTITLPAGSAGDTIVVANAGAALVTIEANGSEKINSSTEDGTLPQGNSAQLVYVDGTIGWFEV